MPRFDWGEIERALKVERREHLHLVDDAMIDAAFATYYENMRKIRRRWKIGQIIIWSVGLLLIAIVLVGCGEGGIFHSEPPIEEGYVREREFTPAHWEGGYEYWTESEYTCSPSYEYNYQTGQYESGIDCGWEDEQHSRYEPHHQWREDHYQFKLEACTVNDEGKEKCRDDWRTVTPNEYERYSVGQHYPDPA